MRSLRMSRRRAAKLGLIVVASVFCAVCSLSGLKARPLECGPLTGGWTSDGTPFEEPELNSDTTTLAEFRAGEESSQDSREVASTPTSMNPGPSLSNSEALWIRVRSLLLRFGWIRSL